MLHVTGLKKQFETDRGASVAAVDNVSFEVATGQLLTLLGPSGCGKTTTLRSIAGLEEPDGGEIQIGSTRRLLQGSGIFSATESPACRNGVSKLRHLAPHDCLSKRGLSP